MTTNKHTIQLSMKELVQLKSIIRRGKHNTRTVTRARILLLSHKGGGKDAIAITLGVNRTTIQDVRDRYRNPENGGLNRALYDAPRTGQPRKLTDTAEAHLVAIACSEPPKGQERWTLELLRKRMVKDKKVKNISTVALWNHLNERQLKPWREKNVVYTKHYTGVR